MKHYPDSTIYGYIEFDSECDAICAYIDALREPNFGGAEMYMPTMGMEITDDIQSDIFQFSSVTVIL